MEQEKYELTYITILRLLADQQQFPALKSNTLAYLDETGDAQALPLLGLAQAQLGERPDALQTVAQAEAALAGLDGDARADLAGVYCLMWRIDDAVALLEPVLAEHPDHSLALARLAWCWMQMGRLQDACELYRRSVQFAPHRLPVWSGFSRLLIELGDHEAAQRALDAATGELERAGAELPATAREQFAAQFEGLQLELWLAQDELARIEAWLESERGRRKEDEWGARVCGYAAALAHSDRHDVAAEALRAALKHYPENMALLSHLAEVAQLQGRTGQAINLLHRLIRLAEKQDKPTAGYWVRLSQASLHQNDAQARGAAEKAVELADGMAEGGDTPPEMIAGLRLQAKNALAQVESQEQHFDVAERLFEAVLAENPYFLPALQGLGQQQMQLGRIDEAVALFERIREIDPVKGYSSLINARRFPEDEETLQRIEQAARQSSLEGSVRGGLLLQLASAWEKRQDFDKAFVLAQQANEASRKLLHYDPAAHRQRCARIRHAFPYALFDHRCDCGYRGEDESLPVFVLGMPRSGTTLVEQIIAGHSAIFGAGELGVIPSRIQGLNRWERHVGSGREYPDCVDDLDAHVSQGIARGILMELKELAAEAKPQARHVVDKLPHNFENIGLIKFLFPKAKIISVRRDPRDIALSNYFTDYQAKHGGMGFAYDMDWIGEQLADHNLLMYHWHQVFPGEILEINYEDVVENTEAMARKMLAYIGVEWEPQVLNFNELDRPVKTASVWQVRQPIYKTSKAKWMRYEKHLAPLIAGTNRKIEWEPVEMVTLPEPGLLHAGVELYKQQKLDEAEYEFKKLLHHIPEHAAASFMVGIIYAIKGHLLDAISLLEKGFVVCPWKPAWRKDLLQAYAMAGEHEKLAAFQQKYPARNGESGAAEGCATDQVAGWDEANVVFDFGEDFDTQTGVNA